MNKIVHVPYTYYPDPVGGTEIYVEQLVYELSALGVHNLIYAPGKADAQYEYRGVPVQRLGVENQIQLIGQLYGEGDEEAAQAFGAYLQAQKPDVVHMHAFTRIVSARMAEQASKRKIPVMFTYHTPTVSCLRSGLMRWGSEACDGTLDADLCTRCRLHSLGVPKPLATILARAPQPLRDLVRPRQGGAWTALRMRDLVAEQHAAFHHFMNHTDKVIALGEWTRELLRRNAVPAERIAVVPHGLIMTEGEPYAVQWGNRQADALRVVTLGRLERIKGIDLLVRALQALPDAPIALDIYGINQSEDENAFARQLRQEIAHDTRIRLLPPVPHKQVISLLGQYDVLAVPSQWFETGPLVVLEAFAAGIPVIGSDLGGIAEKVRDGVDGILVPSLDENAWRDALRRIAQDRSFRERLRANVRPPRSMKMVAQEMFALYEQAAGG